MSTTETAKPSPARRTNNSHGSNKKGGANRGRGGQGGRGRGRGGKAQNPGSPKGVEEPVAEEAKPEAEAAAAPEDAGEDSDEAICWICAEPVKYYSVSECNHRTCHVCALRLRALYKKTDCTFCKEAQPSVVFTLSPDALYSSYDLESMTLKDAKLSIYFETLEMMEETLLLLRFNCPDPDCPYIGNGWGDLKLHCRASHGKMMCDLCIRSKKVFTHEHALYPPNILPLHLPSMYHRGKSLPKDQIEGGIHPLCEFCRECFFGDDELFAHMRERHEECFICKRNSVRDQYFQNYESLEKHFHHAHHPCKQTSCLAQKFVVFGSALDLKAHMVDEHGADMSSRDKRDARRVAAEFAFEEVSRPGRQNRDRGHRDRDREPPPPPQPPQGTAAGPTPAQAASQQPAIARPGPGRRQAVFSGNLTVEGGGATAAAPAAGSSRTPERSRPSSPPSGDTDPAVLERHAMFLARLQSLTPNSPNAVTVVKAGIKGYRASESSAKDLISTVWTVLDQNLDSTASIINSIVDLLDVEDKKQELLASWKGFSIEQRREFPDLGPTSSNNGAYASITAGRVLTAKHATATRSSRRSSRQVWDRVAQAANASTSKPPPPAAPRPAVNNFPALASAAAGPSTQITPAYRQQQRSTAWSAAGATGFRPTPPAIQMQSVTVVPKPKAPVGGGGPTAPPPKLSNAAFPGLPPAQAKVKVPMSGNQSLKNILGTANMPATNAWGAGGSGDSTPAANNGDEAEAEPTPAGAGKGKKGKGKQKQTLFTLGSFPT